MRSPAPLLTVALAAASLVASAAVPPFLEPRAVPASLELGPTRHLEVELSNPVPARTFHVEGYGPSCEPALISAHVRQGGTFGHLVEVAHGGLLSVSLKGAADADLALRLFAPTGRLVAISDRGGPDHALSVRLPADGRWRIEVEGLRAPAGWAEFDLRLDVLQGSGVEVTGAPAGPVAGGEPVPVSVYAATAGAGCSAPRILLVYGPRGGESHDLTLTLTAAPPIRRLTHRVALFEPAP